MSLTLTDLFCGAGGSAQGAHVVPGIELRLAANHWKLAVESHAENFPHADHLVADISQVDPRRVPKTDLLWASPECTNHSQAKGVKRYSQPDLFGETLPSEAVERSRATMWDVPRFAEQHAYSAIVVENVVDAAKWVMWDAWLMAMTSLGASGSSGTPSPHLPPSTCWPQLRQRWTADPCSTTAWPWSTFTRRPGPPCCPAPTARTSSSRPSRIPTTRCR